MQVIITGTDTNIGKTFISSWICYHTNYDYFKPIQTGGVENSDSNKVSGLSNSKIHQESYIFKVPLSPHVAAELEDQTIDINKIILPIAKNLIVEGAGGIMVPINHNVLMIDLFAYFSIPIILVAGSRLGTINHTLLSLEAARARNIKILGVIINGELNQYNYEAIKFYGRVKVLAQVPYLKEVNKNTLSKIPLTDDLRKILIGELCNS